MDGAGKDVVEALVATPNAGEVAGRSPSPAPDWRAQWVERI